MEFAFSVPDRFRMRGLTGKRILRDAVRDLLPDTVLERPKKGFGIPVARWLNGPLRDLLHDVLGDDRLRAGGIFRPARVGRRWESDREVELAPTGGAIAADHEGDDDQHEGHALLKADPAQPDFDQFESLFSNSDEPGTIEPIENILVTLSSDSVGQISEYLIEFDIKPGEFR